MDRFLVSVKSILDKHGINVVYRKIGTQVYDPSTSTVVSNDLEYSIKTYPKHIKASAYNYPDLIGKDSILFYIPADISFSLKQGDIILYNSYEYMIDSYQTHFANGNKVLYRVVAVRG